MIIKVHPHKVEIIKTPVNEKEVNITKCNFEFDEEFNGLIKDAYFTLNGQSYKQILQDDQCNIPSEVLTEKGSVELGVVAYEVQDEELIERYNPSPDYFDTWSGSLKENAENAVPITPTDKEQIEALVQEVQTQMDNIDVEAEKVEHTTTITITKKDGTSYDVQVLDGEKGDKGDKGDAGAIKVLKVNELPTEDIKDDTIYLVPMPVIEVETLPTTGQMYTIYVVISTQKRYRFVSGQWVETLSNDNNLEYMYIDNAWELVGQADIEIDLTDYVKNTDYATQNKGGVVKINANYGAGISPTGEILAQNKDYSAYGNASNFMIISKGTLENVITGKGLVSNTDYASSSTGGVVKVGGVGGLATTSGFLTANTKTYSEYSGLDNRYVIGKGTLDNVLTATIGDISSVIDAINGESI